MPFMGLTLILLFVNTLILSDPTHAFTQRGIWKYFPLFVYVLVYVVLGFGHRLYEAMLAERIIECTGQGEVMLELLFY